MKYKVLLSGRNNALMEDFFTQMDENFETLTTSESYIDVVNHLKYFKPDIFVYCLNNLSMEYLSRLIYIRKRLENDRIPIAIIGSEEECFNFKSRFGTEASLVLTKPLTANSIMTSMTEFLDERQRMKEEYIRAMEEQLAKEKNPPKKHVLVIDDDPLMLKLVKEYLREKYDVGTAPSGKAAFNFLQKRKTDLILLDYAMPVEDGPAVLEKLHSNEATMDIPVIFLTSIVERQKIQKALMMKPQGYMVKPIDHDKLLEVIEKFIG